MGGSKELEYLSSALSILHRLLPTLLPKAEWEDIGYRLDKDTDFEGRIIKSQVLSTSLSPTEAHETSQGEGSWYIYWTVSGCWPHLRMAGLEFCSRLLSVPLCPHAGLVLQGKHSPRCWSHPLACADHTGQEQWIFCRTYGYSVCSTSTSWLSSVPELWCEMGKCLPCGNPLLIHQSTVPRAGRAAKKSKSWALPKIATGKRRPVDETSQGRQILCAAGFWRRVSSCGFWHGHRDFIWALRAQRGV